MEEDDRDKINKSFSFLTFAVNIWKNAFKPWNDLCYAQGKELKA